jgi:hypothetical protein
MAGDVIKSTDIGVLVTEVSTGTSGMRDPSVPSVLLSRMAGIGEASSFVGKGVAVTLLLGSDETVTSPLRPVGRDSPLLVSGNAGILLLVSDKNVILLAVSGTDVARLVLSGSVNLIAVSGAVVTLLAVSGISEPLLVASGTAVTLLGVS